MTAVHVELTDSFSSLGATSHWVRRPKHGGRYGQHPPQHRSNRNQPRYGGRVAGRKHARGMYWTERTVSSHRHITYFCRTLSLTSLNCHKHAVRKPSLFSTLSSWLSMEESIHHCRLHVRKKWLVYVPEIAVKLHSCVSEEHGLRWCWEEAR